MIPMIYEIFLNLKSNTIVCIFIFIWIRPSLGAPSHSDHWKLFFRLMLHLGLMLGNGQGDRRLFCSDCQIVPLY